MTHDSVDNLLIQWGEERPELNCDGLAVAVRIQRLAKLLDAQAECALARYTLTLWEYDVLSGLRRQGPPYRLAASELARASRLSTSAMTHRVNRLEARRLVSRAPDVTDRRTVLVALTPDGVALIDAASSARMAAAGSALASLDQQQRLSLNRLLRALLLAADADEEDELSAAGDGRRECDEESASAHTNRP